MKQSNQLEKIGRMKFYFWDSKKNRKKDKINKS